MTKLFVDNTVYLPVAELQENAKCFLADYDLTPIQIGEQMILCIKEADYNHLLSQTTKETNADIDITKVDCMSVRMKESASLNPLKYMFLVSGMMSQEQAEKKLKEDAKAEFIKNAFILSNTSELCSEHYKEQAKFWKEAVDFIKEKFGGELDIQFVTEITENGNVGLMPFLVGKGIFYNLWSEDWDTYDLGRISVEDGNLHVPEVYDDYDGEISVKKIEHSERDFRAFSVFDNIVWCLKNIELKNDFVDSVEVRSGAIDFDVNTKFLAKLYNDVSFMDYYLFDGILDISEEVSSSGKRHTKP